MAIKLTSSAFQHKGNIPALYTCKGSDISPPLSWEKAPEESKSFAIICDDPDAPIGTWVHWVYYNIPSDLKEIQENMPSNKEFPDGSKHGKNSKFQHGYHGPCPPWGTHQYHFKIYALDTILDINPGLSKKKLLKKMEGHILDKAVLIGKYSKKMK